MVKSRKYAIVTAALALILVAAVVLTVALTGSGVFYTPEQEGVISDAAITVNSTTGTVPNRQQYIFETLTEHSQVGDRGDGWQPSDMNASGEYETTLDSKFFLLSDYDYEGLVSAEVQGVQSGAYVMNYNGAIYRFKNGNAGLKGNLNSLYRKLSMFLTDSAFYQDTAVYGLVFTDSASYNPNDTFSRSWFDATLDGAGATIKPSAALKKTDDYNKWPHERPNEEDGGEGPYVSGVSYIKNGYLDNSTEEPQMDRNQNGVGFAGLMFGAMRYGTFMNFQWNDAGIGAHSYQINTENYGTAFGGLVGLAANSGSTQSTGIKSSVYNVGMNFNNNITHTMHLRNESERNPRSDIYSGGLIGINLNADIELVSINYNSSKFQQNAARLSWETYSTGDLANYWGTSSFGGVVGAQSSKNGMTFTFKKVTVTGGANSGLIGDDNWYHATSDWVVTDSKAISTVYTQQSAVIGSLSGNLTMDGVIIDLNYDNIYTWWTETGYGSRDNTDIQRGILCGHTYNSTITHRNIYLTDKFASNTQTALNIMGTNTTTSVTGTIIGDYTAYYAYIGGKNADNYNRDTSRAFIYASEDVISSINFAYVDPDETFADGEVEPVVEISRPNNTENATNYPGGVMWDIGFYEHGNTTNKALQSYDLFTQNAYEDVQVGSVTSYPSDQYLEMQISYATSYTYKVANGPGGNNSDNKYYDGTQVNYPTFEVDDYAVISGYGNDLLTSNGYLKLQTNADNSITLNLYNGTTSSSGEPVKVGNFSIKNFYNFNGQATNSNNMNDIIGSILQLERNASGTYDLVVKDDWAANAKNANTYRWSTTATGLFAFTTDNTDRKYVFAPSSTTAEVMINPRPVYIQAVDVDKDVPYIGQAYRIDKGNGGTFGMVNYTFGTTQSGSAIIGNDEITAQVTVSGGNAVNAGNYTLTASSLSGSSSPNYQLTNPPDNANAFTISPANVTLNINGGSMTYGADVSDRAKFMSYVDYTLDFDDATRMTAFAARDNITLNLNMKTGAAATAENALLFSPATGSSLTGSVFSFNFPAGEYDVIYESISGTGALNYNVTLGTSSAFTVEKAQLNFNLNAISDFTYGDMSVPATSYSQTGLVSGNTIRTWNALWFTSEGTAYEQANLGAGNYYAQGNITAIDSPGSNSGIDNYNITYGKQKFEVFKRDTTVRFDYDPAASYTYRGEAYSFTALALGNPAFNDNDGIAGKVTFQAYSDVDRLTQTEAKNADTYYTGAVSDALRANYNITGITDKNGDAWETFTIGKATVKLTNTDTTKAVYNESSITFDSNLIQIDFLGVDTLEGEREALIKALSYTYNGSSAAPTDAGTYNVIVTLANQSNYNTATLDIIEGLFIDQMTITIQPTQTEVTNTYNGEMFPDLTYTVQGTNGEIKGLSIVTTYAKEGGESVSNMRDAGTYTVTYTYDGATGNYKSATAEVKYTVKPATLNITLHNKTAVYNTKAYTPDFEITSGLIVGDNAQITYKVNISGTLHDNYKIIDAGDYTLQFSAGNPNYTIASSDVNQSVKIEKYVLSAQAVNSTLLFNINNKDDEYYEGQMYFRVTDADGADITELIKGNVTRELVASTSDTSAVETVDDRGGMYAAKLTITALPDGYSANNYTIEENIYTVYIYRIGLRGKLTTGGDDVTYGTNYAVKGELYAMAGGEEQALTLDENNRVAGLESTEMGSDVLGIQVQIATMTLSGSVLDGSTITSTEISSDIAAIFSNGIITDAMKNAGSYTVTIYIQVMAYYSEAEDREVEITVPYTWTVNPYTISVTPGEYTAYYTESITAEGIMDVVAVEEGLEQYVTVVSSVIGNGSTYVNAGTYEYDVVLNTQAEGYYNYTLPAVDTGNIVIDPLRLVVTVDNASAEYGVAPTLSATAQLFKGDTLFADAPENLSTQYSWVLSSSQQVGSNVGNYKGALTAAVTATSNFTREVEAGDLTITARKLDITLDDVSITYSNGTFEVTYTISGGTLFGSDTRPELTYTSATLDGAEVDFDRVQVKEGGYVLNITEAAFNNDNYVIGTITEGTLTVTPYQITSVTWSDLGTLTYKGAVFEEGELFTVANFENTNGDIVTFSVNYGGEVKNAGSYTARVAVASVANGSDPVDNANYSVASVAAKSFSVAKASLTVSEVDGVTPVEGVITYPDTYSNSAKSIATDKIVFSFGEGLTYSSDRDGALNVSVAYSQGDAGVASPVNAGTYQVSVTVSGDNFASATLTNVTMVIERWNISEEEFANVIQVELPQDVSYNLIAQGASVTFIGALSGLNLEHTLTYFTEEGEVEPVNADIYTVGLLIDTDNVYFSSDNVGEFEILSAAVSRLNSSVPTSEGLDANHVYYSGAPIIPNASVTINISGNPEVSDITVNDSAAFTFAFFKVGGVIDLSTLDETLPSGTYFVESTEPSATAVSKDEYYVFVSFNKKDEDGKRYDGNYGESSGWITDSTGTLVVMEIVAGVMSVRVNSVNAEYNGLVGYNGRDVIYQTADGKWMLNMDLFTFTGVDIAGMKDLSTDLKVGDIVITVSYVYGTDEATGAQLTTALYTYTWKLGTGSSRGEPVKTFLPYAANDDNQQIQGSYTVGGLTVSDFGYAGYNSETGENAPAVYVIDISIDNRVAGSEYAPAQTIKYDENGDPVIVDNIPQTDPAPHTARGTTTVDPAEIDFSMLYTSDFFNDNNDVLDGMYKELNFEGVEGEESLADYILRGVAIPDGGNLLTKGIGNSEIAIGAGDAEENVTLTGYSKELNGATYFYEAFDQNLITVTVKNSAGATVYTYSNGLHSGGGITAAGTYTFEFKFAGIPGKYEPFTYTGVFEQQKAEYHITVTQKENANLKTPFGTEFNLNGVAEQLEIKIEIEAGDYITNTGKYTKFEEDVSNAGGDTTQLSKYIALTGADGNIATEYVDSYKSNVGRYFIYYVFISQDPNLEIVMETESSMIEVVQAAPTIMVDADGEVVDKEKGLTLESQAYQPNYSWNNDILAQVGLGLEYMKLNAEGNGHIAAGENYTTKNVAVATIEYSLNDDSWTPASSVGPVGKYRLTLQSADTNLVGALEEVYVYFEVTKIKAQANVVLNGYAEEGGVFSSTYNGAAHSVGFSVIADGNVVSDAALAGTVNILVAFTENAGDDAYVNIEENNIINAGSYWVKVTVEGSANYEVAPSQVVKITINKADPTIRFEQSEYNLTYNMNGNTISDDDISFELNGRSAPNITAENSLIMYLSVTAENEETALAQQAKVAEMVNAFMASGEDDIVAWLADKAESYPGFAFTNVSGTPAATDAGFYFPVVIFNGDANYNASGTLVTNVPNPLMTVNKAELILNIDESENEDMTIVYGNALSDVTGKEVDKYLYIYWSYIVGDDPVLVEGGDVIQKLSYRLANMNAYTVGDSVGRVENALQLVVDEFESKNFVLGYNDNIFVDVEVTPKEVAFDISKVSVSLKTDADAAEAQPLTAQGYTFERVFNGSAFGPLVVAYNGELGLDINGDNSVSAGDNGVGKHGIFDITASGGFVQKEVTTAGSYSAEVKIALNNTENYKVTSGLGEDNTLTVKVNMVIEKAILKISFDTLTYVAGAYDDETGKYEFEYTDDVKPGEDNHTGWYEYATMYTGSNFDYNNRVYITSYREVDGELVPYGAYSGGRRLGEVGGITEKDGASGNLAAPGEYNIHLMLDQLATNYKFIDSAGNTVGQAADGSQTDLSSLDINVTISPSEFITVLETIADKRELFTYDDENAIFTRDFDGTDINASFIKNFLMVTPYKLASDAGTLKGGTPIELVADRNYAGDSITNYVSVSFADESGNPVTSVMYAGTYTMTVDFTRDTHVLKDGEKTYKLQIKPTAEFKVEKTVKGQTERTYNGTDIVPNLSFTVTVTDFTGKPHTLDMTTFKVNVYKGDVLAFTYDVTDGTADIDAISGNFRDAGTYTVKAEVNNPNLSVTEIAATATTYTITARSLTDKNIRLAPHNAVFDYRTDNNQAVAVSAEDLGVVIAYNRVNLVMGEDFEIVFVDGAGKYTGTYTFKIKGIGNYSDTIERTYSIGASVGIAEAPDAITYGDDSLTVKLAINSLGDTEFDGELVITFDADSVARIVDANDNIVALLGTPDSLKITDIQDGVFTMTFTGLGGVNAGDYNLHLVFTCDYNDIKAGGEISKKASGDNSKVVVNEADVVAAAEGVTATVTAVNSSSVSFNIKGEPSAYEYSLDGTTWVKAVKGANTISGLSAASDFIIRLRINDGNYATNDVHEYQLSVTLSVTTTASVDDIIESAESLARNFNATGFARYAQLLQNVAMVSSGDLAARGDEIDEALAAVEEARAKYVQDLQAAVDSAVGAAEKAAGKGSGASTAATAGLVAGGVSLPVLGIGLIFAAARKRKSKEDDLND